MYCLGINCFCVILDDMEVFKTGTVNASKMSQKIKVN